MAAIWTEGKTGWELLQPAGFPNEQELHDLITKSAQVLPLAGSPTLVVLGTEVPLGSGYADIVAVETTGRPVVIEVKLAKNPESRRAVIAQILAYASSVYRATVDDLTRAVGPNLAKAGFSSIVAAVEDADQDRAVDPTAFAEALAANMASGDIRLVLVLDSAPPELIGVVGYLGAIAPNLTLDLITVTAFKVGEQSVIVPQRIEPGKVEAPSAPPKPASKAPGPGTTYSQGTAEFEAGIELSPAERRAELRRYLVWAEGLADAGWATLRTGRGQGRWTLLPIVKGGDAGLVTIWNDSNGPAISPWRSALGKWAPQALAALEGHEPPVLIAQGNALHNVDEATLRLFYAAYEEAATSGLVLPELVTDTRAILVKLGPWVAEPDPDTGRSGYGYLPGMSLDDLYKQVRAWWVLDPKRAETYHYAVAIHNGATIGAWEIAPGSWRASPQAAAPKPGESVRWAFEGVPAPPEIADEFVGERGKRVPKFRKNGSNVFGQANPIAYWP